MKYIFIVQGEGRGHMTQAISLQDLLLEAGHEVSLVLVGKSERRDIPSFFYEKIKAPIETFQSPNFVLDGQNKSIRLGATVWQNLKKQRTFFKNMSTIHRHVKAIQPDVVINFYDLLAGLYFALYRPKVKYVCIGHQYLLLHPDFEFPKGRKFERFLLQMNTRNTSFRADRLLGLSFRDMPDDKKNKLVVVPPLLRKEVAELSVESGDFLLGYMVNDGYAEEIMSWQKSRPEVNMHCFYDRKGRPKEEEVQPNLTFHQLDDVKFLEKMRKCKGFASTAGFESICEAMYLGKPVCLVPTQNQFEQACNAIDAVASGAGIMRNDFQLDEFLDYIPKHNTDQKTFRHWTDKAKSYFIKQLTEF